MVQQLFASDCDVLDMWASFAYGVASMCQWLKPNAWSYKVNRPFRLTGCDL